jgi:hypothetical protein
MIAEPLATTAMIMNFKQTVLVVKTPKYFSIIGITADIQSRQQSGGLPATLVKGRLAEPDIPLPQLRGLL